MEHADAQFYLINLNKNTPRFHLFIGFFSIPYPYMRKYFDLRATISYGERVATINEGGSVFLEMRMPENQR